MGMSIRAAGLLCVVAVVSLSARAADWPRFRGPDGGGISSEKNLPAKWSDTENVKWKFELPGPGSSSPIVVGERVFVTYYSGYGVSKASPGRISNLRRHLLCVHRDTGKMLWSKAIKPILPEDTFRGYITEHGYASHTPVSDGQRVYAFFGKAGVFAFDLDGKPLWRTSVGVKSGRRKWGSASSPILHKDLIIVNASEESRSLVAINKTSGKRVWFLEDKDLEMSYGTPVVVTAPAGRVALVVAVPEAAWGVDLATGKRLWRAKYEMENNISPSVVSGGGMAYIFGGYKRPGSVAVRLGGTGDVTRTHTVWDSKISSYVPTPVYHQGYLYWVSDKGVANCVDAKTGKSVFAKPVISAGASSRAKPFYAATVLADGKVYALARTGTTYVIAAKPKLEPIAANKLSADGGVFNGTPAISDGRIFIRSTRYLYCIGAE